MDEMESEVEFLDADPDEVESPLPPGAAWRRPIAFVLILGLSLAGLISAGVHTYRRDLAADRAAGTLTLSEVATGDPVSLGDASSLGRGGTWRADPSTTVEVDLTNWSPDPVTLLPGALRGPGVIAGNLTPRETGPLGPGRVAHLIGTVTVDCGLAAASGQATSGTSLLARARLANGDIGSTTLGLDKSGESVPEQICLQQGAAVVSANFQLSADPSNHLFVFGLTARSLAAAPLHYVLEYQYINLKSGQAGPALGPPRPSGHPAGVVEPGGDLSAGFAVPVTRCSDALPAGNAAVRLQLSAADPGRPVLLQADSFDLSLLVQAACGRFD